MQRWLIAGATLVVLSSILTQVEAQAVQNIVLRNSFSPIGAGARGVGMGGAFIAVADDGTAATFNPAGLAQLRRPELAIVGFSSSFSSTVGGSSLVDATESAATHGAIDFIGLAVPFDVGSRRLTFQISYQRAVDLFGEGRAVLVDELALQDLGVAQPGRVGVSVGVFPQQTGALHNISAATGLQITERLSLGASLNYWIGDWMASGTRDVRFFQTSAARPSLENELGRIRTSFEQQQSLSGFNINTGFLLKYRRVSFGGVLRLPFDGDYRLEEFTESVFFDPDIGTSTPELDAYGVTSRLSWPRSAGLGIAIRPFSGLTLTGDVSTVLWSRASIEQLPDGALLTDAPTDDEGNELGGFTDRNFFDLLPKSVTATSDSTQWRGGAEWLLPLGSAVFPIRGGVFHSTSPFTQAIEGESSGIQGYTFGTGINFSSFVFDIAFERRESDVALGLRRLNSADVFSNPTEKVSYDRVVASVIFRFDNDGGLGEFFRSLFTGSDDEGGSE